MENNETVRAASKPAGPAAPTELEVQVPGTPSSDALALLYGTAIVHVGDNSELAFQQFPRPKGAVESSDEPPVKIVGAKTAVWDKDQESFAVLSLDERVLVAVHTKPLATSVQVLLDRYTKKFGQPEFVSRGQVEYRFWDTPELGQTLMLCWAPNASNTTLVTAAVGLTPVMREFRMDPSSAEADAMRASNLLSAQTPK